MDVAYFICPFHNSARISNSPKRIVYLQTNRIIYDNVLYTIVPHVVMS